MGADDGMAGAEMVVGRFGVDDEAETVNGGGGREGDGGTEGDDT